jgi:hypothetical protein
MECKDSFSVTHADECECLRKLWSARFGLHIVSVLQVAVFILKRRSFEILGVNNTTNTYSNNVLPTNNNTTTNNSLTLANDQNTQLESNISNISGLSINNTSTEHSPNSTHIQPTLLEDVVPPLDKQEMQPTDTTQIQTMDAAQIQTVDVNSQYELSHLPTFRDVALLAEHHESIPDYDINYYRHVYMISF